MTDTKKRNGKPSPRAHPRRSGEWDIVRLHEPSHEGSVLRVQGTDELDLFVNKLQGLIAMNIAIRMWQMKDAPDLATAINNKNILDKLHDVIPYPYMEKDAKEFIHAVLVAEKDSQYPFAITLDDKVIGSIHVFRKEDIYRLSAKLGYFLAEPYWGKGIMTGIVRQVCADVFENTDIVRIFATAFAHNAASCRVLEKAGFQCEGVLRQSAIKNGQVLDTKMYALLKSLAKGMD